MDPADRINRYLEALRTDLPLADANMRPSVQAAISQLSSLQSEVSPGFFRRLFTAPNPTSQNERITHITQQLYTPHVNKVRFREMIAKDQGLIEENMITAEVIRTCMLTNGAMNEIPHSGIFVPHFFFADLIERGKSIVNGRLNEPSKDPSIQLKIYQAFKDCVEGGIMPLLKMANQGFAPEPQIYLNQFSGIRILLESDQKSEVSTLFEDKQNRIHFSYKVAPYNFVTGEEDDVLGGVYLSRRLVIPKEELENLGRLLSNPSQPITLRDIEAVTPNLKVYDIRSHYIDLADNPTKEVKDARWVKAKQDLDNRLQLLTENNGDWHLLDK